LAKRTTSSVAKCDASAALPPFPHTSSLFPCAQTLIDHIGSLRHLRFEAGKCAKSLLLPLQSHRVIEEVQTLAAGLILKRLLLIQLFDARSKINARLCSRGAPTGLLSCLTFLKPVKIAATRAPREQTRTK
jgi:hypothetical protein